MKKKPSRRNALAALRKENERAELELIRKRLALPPDKRMNFLRKRIGIGISAL